MRANKVLQMLAAIGETCDPLLAEGEHDTHPQSLITGVIVSTRPQFYRLSIWTRSAPAGSGTADDEKLRERIASRGVSSEAQARALLREVLIEECGPEMDRSIRALPHEGKPAVVLVVGVNGTGKSTLLGALAGTRTPEAGTIRRGSGARISHLDQDAPLPAGTVASVTGDGWEAAAVRDRLGLAGLDDRPTDQLSGGQVKRVALARAKGLLGPGQRVRFDSLLSARPGGEAMSFVGSDAGAERVRVEGRAFYTGACAFVVEDGDGLSRDGFVL